MVVQKLDDLIQRPHSLAGHEEEDLVIHRSTVVHQNHQVFCVVLLLDHVNLLNGRVGVFLNASSDGSCTGSHQSEELLNLLPNLLLVGEEEVLVQVGKGENLGPLFIGQHSRAMCSEINNPKAVDKRARGSSLSHC